MTTTVVFVLLFVLTTFRYQRAGHRKLSCTLGFSIFLTYVLKVLYPVEIRHKLYAEERIYVSGSTRSSFVVEQESRLG